MISPNILQEPGRYPPKRNYGTTLYAPLVKHCSNKEIYPFGKELHCCDNELYLSVRIIITYKLHKVGLFRFSLISLLCIEICRNTFLSLYWVWHVPSNASFDSQSMVSILYCFSCHSILYILWRLCLCVALHFVCNSLHAVTFSVFLLNLYYAFLPFLYCYCTFSLIRLISTTSATAAAFETCSSLPAQPSTDFLPNEGVKRLLRSSFESCLVYVIRLFFFYFTKLRPFVGHWLQERAEVGCSLKLPVFGTALLPCLTLLALGWCFASMGRERGCFGCTHALQKSNSGGNASVQPQVLPAGATLPLPLPSSTPPSLQPAAAVSLRPPGWTGDVASENILMENVMRWNSWVTSEKVQL